jgi:lipopolysaccharide export system permease protein
MKKIDKLILKSFIGPFLLTFVVVVFILLSVTLIKYFDDFVGKDLGFAVFAELIFYFSLNLTPTALPLSMLLSSLICFGNLGEHYELTAIKSAGISLLRVLFPIFIFSLMLSFVAFWFNNTIVPKANLSVFSLLWDVRQKKPSLDIKEGVFYNGLSGISIKVNKKLPDGETMLDMMIYDHREGNGNRNITLADSGKMYTIHEDRYLVLDLFKGSSYAEPTSGRRQVQDDDFRRDAFKHATLVFSLASFDMSRTKKEMFASNKMMKNIDQLQQVADSMEKEHASIQESIQQNIKQYYSSHLKLGQATLDTMDDTWTDSLIEAKTFAIEQRKEMLNRAATQARNIRNFTQNNLQELALTLKESRTFRIEKHKKFTLSVACLIMFLIGAPLGAIIKKGGLGVPVLMSIVFFIIFYVISLLGENWAKGGLIAIPYGVWGANCILFCVGLFFLKQAKNDSRLFEADVYKVALNEILERWEKFYCKIINRR